jgi:CII-binding regulator of phage lambda lysogenization HflD
MLKEKTMKSNKAKLDALMEAYNSMRETDDSMDEGIFGNKKQEMKDELEAIEKQLEADNEAGVKPDGKLIVRRNKLRDALGESVEEGYSDAVSYVRKMRDHLETMILNVEKESPEDQKDIFTLLGNLFHAAARKV